MYYKNSPKVSTQSADATQDSLRHHVHQRGLGNARAHFKRKAHLFMLLLRYASRISGTSATSSVNRESASKVKCSTDKQCSTFNISLQQSGSSIETNRCKDSRRHLKRKVSLDTSAEKTQESVRLLCNKKVKPDEEHFRHQQRRRSSQFYIFINSNYEINILNDERLEPTHEQNESQTKCGGQIEEISAPELESFFSLDALDEEQAMRLIHSATIGQGSFGRVLRSKLNGQNLAIKVTIADGLCDCKGEQNGLRLNQHLNVAKTHHIIKLRSQPIEDPLQQNFKKCLTAFSQRNFETSRSKENDLLTVSERTKILLLGLLGSAIQTVLGGEVQLVLMELAGDMSLQQVIDDHLEQRLDKQRRFILLRQICSALVYLKRNRIAHLDLKPANVMINRSTNLVKLIDFGCSKEIPRKCLPLTLLKPGNRKHLPITSPNRLTVNPLDTAFLWPSLKVEDDGEKTNFCNRTCKCSLPLSIQQDPDLDIGTVLYTAPEIFRKTVVDYFQADIFSLGITMWQMASRQTPYLGENVHSIIYRVSFSFQ